MLCLYLSNVYSQTKFWEILSNSPVIGGQYNGQPYRITRVVANSKGVLVGYGNANGKFLQKSLDNGKNWTDISKNLPNLFKIGDYGNEKINKMFREGSYVKIHSLESLGSSFFLLAQFVSGDQPNALSNPTLLIRSDDDGKTWYQVKTDFNIYISSVMFCNHQENKLFIYANYAGMSNNTMINIGLTNQNTLEIYETADLGKNWRFYTNKDNVEINTSYLDPIVGGETKEYVYLLNNKNTWYDIAEFNRSKERSYSQCGVINTKSSRDFEIVKNTIMPNVYCGQQNNESINVVKSLQGGHKWQTISEIKKSGCCLPEIQFIDCNNNIYAFIREPNKGLYRSKDLGKNWERLLGLEIDAYNFYREDKLSKSADGSLYLVENNKIYKSTEKIVCNNPVKPEPEITYGTTVITHGYQLDGNAPIYKKGDWAYDMAEAILQKANNKGCIKKYNKNTGKFDTKIDKGDGENILLFDWASESNFNIQGYSEAAGDALFSSLILGNKNNEFGLNNIHFIGHSRGTVVNTEAVERLLSLEKESAYSSKISINQVTNLDPHDWGGLNSTLAKDFDNHPNLVIDCPHIGHLNNGVISWEGSGFNDTYYQVGNSTLGSGVLLDGRPVRGTYNVNWSVEAPGHSEIHKHYLKSILNTSFSNGYKHSRIVNSLNTIKPEPSECGKEREVVKYDYFKPMIFNNFSRIRGIMNGSFDRGYAGWEEHGGIKPSFKNILDMKSSLDCNECANLTISDSLVHNRFYIPVNAKSIKFQYKAAKFKNGKIRIEIVDILDKKNLKDTLIDLKEANEYKEESIDILNLQDKVVMLKFKFITNLADTKYYPQLLIDNVKLSTEGITRQKKLPLKNENDNIQITSNATIVGKLNSNFNTNEGWNTTSGESIFEKGKVSLKPDKNSTPVKLFSNAFNISANARQLKLKIAKNLVGKGELKVSLKNIATNAIDDIYISKINNVGKKIDNILTNANKVLDGDLNLKKIEPIFEAITIDISKFAGTAVVLELYFTNTGSSKQPVLIDEITIN